MGAQAPPLTKQISNILNRYPEGGQILKVYYYANTWYHNFIIRFYIIIQELDHVIAYGYVCEYKLMNIHCFAGPPSPPVLE